MQCDIGTLKTLRNSLTEASSEAKALGSIVDAAGESYALTAKLFDNLAKSIRNPDKIKKELNQRVSDLKKPFHKAIRKELGEDLNVVIDGVSKPHYLLSTELTSDPEAPSGMRVIMRAAPHGDLEAVKTLVFNMDSDTSVDFIGGTIGTITGVKEHLRKTAVKVSERAKLEARERAPINDEGDAELGDTLNRMRDGDDVLGSSRNQTSDSVKGYEKLPDFIHGNIDSMKELMVKLHVLGQAKAPKELMEYYSSLLDKMHPSFFNHMNIYLKKNGLESAGHVNYTKDSLVLDVNTKVGGRFEQSEAEIYMHEVVHTMTAWALRQKVKSVGSARTGLNKAMEVAKQKVVWQDFLEVAEEFADSRDVERAKDKMAYIFSSDNNVEEFMAYTMTNPKLMELTQNIKMKDNTDAKKPVTVFDRALNLLGTLLNATLGTFGFKDNSITVFDEVNNLAASLAAVNNRNAHSLKSKNPIGSMMEVLEDGESILSRKLHQLGDKLSSKSEFAVPEEGASAYANAKFYLTSMVRGITNPAHRGFFGLWATALKITPEGTIREFLGGVFEKDGVYRLAERLGLRMDAVGAARNAVINANSREITQAFKKEPTHEEENALTRVLLDTNLTTFRYKRVGSKQYSIKEIRQLLLSEDARYTREGRVKHKINELLSKDKDTKRGAWSIAQAMSLGYYMSTGIGHSALNMNSGNIAIGYGTAERYAPVKGLETLLAELATLTAVKHANPKQKIAVAGLMKSEPTAVNVIMDKYEGYKKQSKKHLFSKGTQHMMEGHSKEIFDDSVGVTVAPLSKKAELEAQGYTMQYQLPKQSGIAQKEPTAMFTTGSWGKAERLQGAVALGKLHSRGTTLSSIKRVEDPGLAKHLFRRDFAKVFSASTAIHESMRDGTFDVTKVDNGLIPVYSNSGKPVDFRYIMSKENKEKLLVQDLRVSQVLSRSMAGIQYQVQADALNKDSLTALQEDMRNNWKEGTIGEDRYSEYALIGPNSTDPKMKEMYAMLPDSYREFILSRSDKTLAVRRDTIRMMMGGTHLKTSDIPGLNRLPGVIKSAVDMAEGMWMELIKLSKGAILLKMPMVLTSNIVSNIIQQVTQGAVDIPQLARDYRDSTLEVQQYVKYKRDVTKLEQALISDKEALRRVKSSKVLSNRIREKTTEMEMKTKAMLQNPAHAMFEAGMYQSHIEDLDQSALSETNKLVKTVNDRASKLPKVLRDAADVAYMTQNTSWYKASQEVLQMSDMVARVVDYKTNGRVAQRQIEGSRRLPNWWLDTKGKDYNETQSLSGKDLEEFTEQEQVVRMDNILENYVNYIRPNSTFEEYMNRMGILMFTKRIKRIQKVIATTSMSNPIKSAVLMAGITAGVDVDVIQLESMMSGLYGTDGSFSIFNVFNTYSPLYHLENVLTPAIVKDEVLGGIVNPF